MQKFFLVLALILLPAFLQAQGPPDAGFIINSAIQRLSDYEVSKESFSYLKKQVIEELDDNAKVKKSFVKMYAGTFKDGNMSESLIEDKDKEFSPAPLTLDLKSILLSGRYSYSLEGISILNQREAYAVRFEPRHPSKQPQDEGDSRQKITNRILNNLTGTIYVDTENFTIWRAEVHLNKPPMSIYTVARLHQLDITIEQQEFAGLPVGKQVVAIYRYDKFLWWFSTFRKESFTYDNYAGSQ